MMAAAVVTLCGTPTTREREPQGVAPELLAPQRVENEGVTTLRSAPFGETQPTLAGTPPTDTAVELLKAGPADKGGGSLATRMRCVAPESVNAHIGFDADGKGGCTATEASADRAESEASTRLPFVQGEEVALPALLLLTPSSVAEDSTATSPLQEDLNDPCADGSSRRTSYAKGSTAGSSKMGRDTKETGG